MCLCGINVNTQVKKEQIQTRLTGLKLGNYKAIHYHPAYLTYVQSTLCEMPDWMNHKLESRLPGESQGQGAWWAAVYGVAQSRTQLK